LPQTTDDTETTTFIRADLLAARHVSGDQTIADYFVDPDVGAPEVAKLQ
jgi:hypothetical protein